MDGKNSAERVKVPSVSDSYVEHAEKYKPLGRTRILFIAEAPPNSLDRYFYFENVQTNDWLFINLMKALYQDKWRSPREERKIKNEWLKRFQKSGLFLVDAVSTPISGSPRKRVCKISEHSQDLIIKIQAINPECIVLIKATVYEALFDNLKRLGLPVTNEESVPFPSNGQQAKFHEKISRIDCVKRFIEESTEESD